MPFEVTPAHQAIFDAVKAGQRNLQISAVAGSGKTSTIIEALNFVEPGKSILFLAFNKRIVEELVKRVPGHVTVMTMNAMGHHALMGHLRNLGIVATLESDKLRRICKDMLPEREERLYGSAVVKLCQYGKASGILPHNMPGFLERGSVPDSSEIWEHLAFHYDLEIAENVDMSEVCHAASQLLRKSCEKLDVIDFDDQLLLTYGMNVPLKRFDRVFVDEAQDLSPLQNALIKRAIAKNGNIIAVGDPHQAIYAFRGADSSSMANMQKDFNMLELPLHVSYRCPQDVVAYAQRYVSHIKAHESAPKGTVIDVPRELSECAPAPGDMVVCRFNAPAVRAAYSLLRSGTPCIVLGRDIGKGLQSLVRKLKANSLTELEERLGRWRAAEISKAIEKGNLSKQASTEDKAETLTVFIDVSEDMADLAQRIDAMFADAAPGSVVTCCTIHKSKGLEADRVFIVEFSGMPSKYAKKDWQLEQETNLIYVAITRAKKHLQMVVVGKGDGRSAPRQQDRVQNDEPPVRMVAVTGNTYRVKERLKQLGAKWDADAKIWRVPSDQLTTANNIIRKGY